jgi:hypothetical protein
MVRAGLWLCVAFFCTAAAAGSYARASGIVVEVVEGEGALNSIAARRAREPVVRVQDREGRPVPGAVVNFILPAQGPGGAFAGGELSFTAVAGEDGKVAGRGLRPNRTAGPFQIRVTASAAGETAVASINQTNVAPPAGAAGNSRRYMWLALIGGAAVGGTVAATRGGGSAPAPGSPGGGVPGGTTVAPGSPTFGPPR